MIIAFVECSGALMPEWAMPSSSRCLTQRSRSDRSATRENQDNDAGQWRHGGRFHALVPTWSTICTGKTRFGVIAPSRRSGYQAIPG